MCVTFANVLRILADNIVVKDPIWRCHCVLESMCTLEGQQGCYDCVRYAASDDVWYVAPSRLFTILRRRELIVSTHSVRYCGY